MHEQRSLLATLARRAAAALPSSLRAGAIALSLVLAFGASTPTFAEDLHVRHAWARATPPGTEVGAVYLELHNAGDSSLDLVSASTPVAERSEIHETVMEGDVMRMERRERVAIPAESAVRLAPGGLHLMLLGLGQPLVEGERFDLRLEFAGGLALDVAVEVKGIGAAGADSAGHGHSKHAEREEGEAHDHGE